MAMKPTIAPKIVLSTYTKRKMNQDTTQPSP
jgi:hypothetical protein